MLVHYVNVPRLVHVISKKNGNTLDISVLLY